jgi:hypothetical protein
LRESFRPQTQDQVRIEQHVVIRITPGPPSARRDLFSDDARAGDPPRFTEKKADRCVPIEDIAGLKPLEPNRLVLFLRDHRMLSATLEQACDPEAFYLGAYIEQTADGKLCIGRDTLRARTGATCRISRMSRLVAVKD